MSEETAHSWECNPDRDHPEHRKCDGWIPTLVHYGFHGECKCPCHNGKPRNARPEGKLL